MCTAPRSHNDIRTHPHNSGQKQGITHHAHHVISDDSRPVDTHPTPSAPLPLELRHDEYTAGTSPRHRVHRFDGAPPGRLLPPRQRHLAGDAHDPRGSPHGRGLPRATRRLRKVRPSNCSRRGGRHPGRSGRRSHRHPVDPIPRRRHHRGSRCHPPAPRPRRDQRVRHPRGTRPRNGPPHARGHRRPRRRIRGDGPPRLLPLHDLPRPVRYRTARRGLLPRRGLRTDPTGLRRAHRSSPRPRWRGRRRRSGHAHHGARDRARLTPPRLRDQP